MNVKDLKKAHVQETNSTAIGDALAEAMVDTKLHTTQKEVFSSDVKTESVEEDNVVILVSPAKEKIRAIRTPFPRLEVTETDDTEESDVVLTGDFAGVYGTAMDGMKQLFPDAFEGIE